MATTTTTPLPAAHPAIEWYTAHEALYDRVRGRLARVHDTFVTAENAARKRLLARSYVYAVMSQRTQTDRCEQAYADWVGGTPLPDALDGVVYPNQKRRWIYSTLRADGDPFGAVLDALDTDGVDAAHEVLADRFVGLGMTKAAFVLAMLGYTSRMCLDSNVLRFAGYTHRTFVDERHDLESYLAVADDLYQRFAHQIPQPFIAQWCIFDVERGEHESHDAWFGSVLG